MSSNAIVPKNSQFAKDGVVVTYTDGSAQNLSFANKTLTVDRGLVVNVAKTTLNQGLDVNNVVANLNKGLVVDGGKTTLKQGLELSENSGLEVKGNSLFSKDVKIDAANLEVNGTISVSKMLTASNGATISGGALLANMGANVSGGVFNALQGADVKNGLTVSSGSFTAATGATINGGALLANMGANVSGAALLATLGATVSGAMFNAENGATVKSGLTVSTGDFKALNGATVSNALFSASKGAAISGDLLTVSNGANVSGAFNVLNGASVRGGVLSAYNGANVSGAFNAINGATISNGLTVNQTETMNNDLLVNANATISKGLTVNGGLTALTAGVTVTGQTMSNSLVVTHDSQMKGDLKIDGNLTVLGTQTFVNTQNLEVKDNAILVADGNVTDNIESGLMLQYKPTGSSAPKYAGMKRVPVTGEFIFFKDADNQIGNNDGGNVEALRQVDVANAALINAQAAKTAASAAVLAAQPPIDAATSAKNAAQAEIVPYAGSDAQPPIEGAYVIIDFFSSSSNNTTDTPLTGFNIGPSVNGWTSLGKTSFLGSNDKNGDYTFIGRTTFSSAVNGVEGVRNYNFPAPVSYRYLKIVYENLDSGYSGTYNNLFCPSSQGGTLGQRLVANSQITLSAGLSSFVDMNGGYSGYGTVNLNYFQIYVGENVYDISQNGTGAYTASPKVITNAVIDSNEYRTYVSNMAVKQAAVAAAIVVLNAAIANKNLKIADETAAATAVTDAIALRDAKQAIFNSFAANIYATLQADSFNSASDSRLKKDIVQLDGALEKLDAIRGVRYNWIAEAMGEHQVGVIAQEIQSVYPELVKEGGNGFLSVDYPKLTAVLIQALKELKAIVLSK